MTFGYVRPAPQSDEMLDAPGVLESEPAQSARSGSATRSPGLRQLIVQAKMAVGPVGDADEQEADATAARVVKMLRTPEGAGTEPTERATPGMQRVQRIGGRALPADSRAVHAEPRVQRATAVGLDGGRTHAEHRIPSGRGAGTLIQRDGEMATKDYRGYKQTPMKNEDGSVATDPHGEPLMSAELVESPSASDLMRWNAAGYLDIDAGLGDEAKLDALLALFKANTVGWTYTGPSRAWAADGDCGSITRTFIAIAKDVLGVDGLKKGGSPGPWYINDGADTSREIGGRLPNVAGDSGYLYVQSHVWAEWNGTVYDVLFGQKGQFGTQITKTGDTFRLPDDREVRESPDGPTAYELYDPHALM